MKGSGQVTGLWRPPQRAPSKQHPRAGFHLFKIPKRESVHTFCTAKNVGVGWSGLLDTESRAIGSRVFGYGV